MFDDAICDAADMRSLQRKIENSRVKLANCHLCFHCNPQAGHDDPFCRKRGTEKNPYRLSRSTIPKSKCHYFKSAKKGWDEIESRRRLENAEQAFKDLQPHERKKFLTGKRDRREIIDGDPFKPKHGW